MQQADDEVGRAGAPRGDEPGGDSGDEVAISRRPVPMTGRPTAPPVYAHPPEKVEGRKLRNVGLGLIENVFFGVVMVLSFLFGLVLLRQGERVWSTAGYLILFWAVMAYLALPRLHRVLSAIYVPGYFIGRSRTADGLLGDPINLAVRGEEAQIHEAMRAAGWVKADPVTLGTSWGIIRSSITRKSYPEAPVSPLLLFDHIQSFAYQQEVDGNAAQRHHIRFWKCPDGWLLPGGYRVDWLAAGTYDRAVGFSLFTMQVTHKIDRDIDVERDYVIDTVRYAVPEAKVEVIEDFSTGYHSRNGGGDEVSTDGDLPILELQDVPVGAAAAAVEDAELPGGELGEVGKRPFSIIAAWVLILASAVVSIGGLLLDTGSITDDPELTAGVDAGGRTLIAMIFIGIVLVIYAIILWFAWRTYQGSTIARLTVVAFVTFSQCFQVATYLTGTRPTTGALLGLSVDLLTVYALTSLSAREWTANAAVRRRHRRERAAAAARPNGA